MGLTRSEQDAHLAELYARIPRIPDCDGRCWTSCGPVDMSDRERQRIRAAGTRITPYQKATASPERFWCDALTGDKRCAVYDLRPLVCLLPGAWIYTAEGPKRIEEIFAGDTAYGADGKLHRVIATASRYYTGTVVNVRHTGTHVPCWSTDDHQWLAARHKDNRDGTARPPHRGCAGERQRLRMLVPVSPPRSGAGLCVSGGPAPRSLSGASLSP